ncbi:hypothetical protein [Streptomyces katsurahamanus]|uniref:Uncharacterized protein n=1 Tax=Streptomyces katsurahamanus TaxID=2577098 RepID=A0ABW9P122_9ACTN|nr:hypothetical protein [Streptomyces katsurahamanus]MQS39276.1 hypothetical protein [Streptomyces katsurahamanus]
MSFGQGGGPQWGSDGQQRVPYDPQQGGQGPYESRPQQGGQRPYDPQQGGQAPFDPFGSGPAQDPASGRTPDWAALADASAAKTRRKRLFLLGGGVLATAAIAGIVATAIVSSSGDGGSRSAGNTAEKLPGPEALPSGASQPEPSFASVAPPPPPDPKDFVSDEKKDTAPLTADSLFPGKKLTMADRAYAKGATARTGDCASAVRSGLGPVLQRNGCDQVFRATYAKDGIAVTVGVAVFGREAEAKKALQQTDGSVLPLKGAGVPAFCEGGPVCRFTANSYGRYAYFTATGYTTAKSVTAGDRTAFRAGDDIAEFTFRQIVRRGNVQASAAAVDPAG